MERFKKCLSSCRRLLTLVLLLTTASCFILRAQSTTNSVEPKASFDKTSLEVTVGQLSVTKPVLTVTDLFSFYPVYSSVIKQINYHYEDYNCNS